VTLLKPIFSILVFGFVLPLIPFLGVVVDGWLCGFPSPTLILSSSCHSVLSAVVLQLALNSLRLSGQPDLRVVSLLPRSFFSFFFCLLPALCFFILLFLLLLSCEVGTLPFLRLCVSDTSFLKPYLTFVTWLPSVVPRFSSSLTTAGGMTSCVYVTPLFLPWFAISLSPFEILRLLASFPLFSSQLRPFWSRRFSSISLFSLRNPLNGGLQPFTATVFPREDRLWTRPQLRAPWFGKILFFLPLFRPLFPRLPALPAPSFLPFRETAFTRFFLCVPPCFMAVYFSFWVSGNGPVLPP